MNQPPSPPSPPSQATVLILSNLWPEPTSSAGGARAVQIIQACVTAGWSVQLGVTAAPSEHSIDCASLGNDSVQVRTAQVAMNDSGFDQWVKNLNPEIVIFDRFICEEQFGWRVAEQCPQALRVLDTIDVHFLRRARQQELNTGAALNLLSDDALRELASYYRSDLSLILSEVEMEILHTQMQMPRDILHYLPFMIPDSALQTEKNPSFEQRQHFMMIGNFMHQPNWDAVQWTYKEIWPLIRQQLPQAEMHVYGAYASDKHMQLHQPSQGFHVLGRAEHAVECLRQYRVNCAPLRFGAGIKGKITDGFLAGTPCVSTQIGAEAMHGDLPWPGTLADSAEDFANAAVELYQHEEQWTAYQGQGYEIIKTCFSEHQHQSEFIRCLKELQAKREQHRRSNIVGAILRHHTLKSTTYMSRWIEEKNKRK